jgi:predicted GNAT family acetyltransferase
MELWIGLDLERFFVCASEFVAAKIERNVLATVLVALQQGRYEGAMFAVAGDERGKTVGVAMRTPPHKLLVAGEIADPGVFLEAWQGLDPALHGVSAETALARTLAGEWMRQTGGHTEVDVREALHVLHRVTGLAEPAPGRLRQAQWRESAQLVEWGRTFRLDAGVAHPELADAATEHAIEHGQLYVWEVAGQSVAMVGHTATIAGVVRVGPVYTPERLRGRGYGTAATAALSQRLLDDGAERCMLYTDLANPVSNHIYAKIGYVRIAGWEEISFHPRQG